MRKFVAIALTLASSIARAGVSVDGASPVTNTVSVTADAPLTGAGTSDSHLSMPVSSNSADGYLSSTDHTTLSTAVQSVGAVTTATANGAAISGTAISLAPASATTAGILNTGTQSFAGAKTATTSLTSPLVTGTTSVTTPLLKGSGTNGVLSITAQNDNTLAGPAFTFNTGAVGGYVGNVYSFQIGNTEQVRFSNAGEVIANYVTIPNGGHGFIGQSGAFFCMAGADISGTPGDGTINAASGILAIAATSATATITNSLSETTSDIFAVARTNDATCSVKNVVPNSGNFVVNMTANCTGITKVGFLINRTVPP